MLLHSFLWGLSFGSGALAGTIPRAEPPTRALVERQASSSSPLPGTPDGECKNGPLTRQCWSNGYSVSTDFDAKRPPDGDIVEYWLEISNTTKPNPDGHGEPRSLLLINGTYPGPTLRAKWGDTVIVNVKNNLQHNGTGIHWHGIRQLNSCQHDGVPGVTECPIAPGKTRQYKFNATQFGTTWYHSHWSIQYGAGIVGPLIIDGPATSAYDEDLGALPLTDWYYNDTFTLNEETQAGVGAPPPPDNLLVNGTHVDGEGNGKYAKLNVVKGKKYRVRIINTSVDSYFTVSADGHPFTVITSDFVPIKPYVATEITLAIGQRYDVIINANQDAKQNYWLRVVPAKCGTTNAITSKVAVTGAILHYSEAPDSNPADSNRTVKTDCADEPTASLVPYVPNEVPESIIGDAGRLYLNSTRIGGMFRWLIDGTPHIVDWNKPTLKTILNKSTDFGPNSNVHSMQTDGWYLWWIQAQPTGFGLSHPIHLHGHDFYLLGTGQGEWDGSTNGLNLHNPTRRDTATLPPTGYLLMAFPADNPGMWIMHCHIAWHASQGLSMQFGERYSDLQGGSLRDTSGLTQGCSEWDDYWTPGTRPDKPYNQTDSGI